MCIITLIRTTKTWWVQMYSMDEHKAHRDNRFNFWEAFSTQQLAHSGLKNKGPAIQSPSEKQLNEMKFIQHF